MLLTDDAALANSVDASLQRRLATVATADTARASLERNGCCAVLPLDRAAERANAIAPEHLALHGNAAESLEPRLHSYGSLFVGSLAAEAFSGARRSSLAAGISTLSASCGVAAGRCEKSGNQWLRRLSPPTTFRR